MPGNFTQGGVELVAKGFGGFMSDLGKANSRMGDLGSKSTGLGGKLTNLGGKVLSLGATLAKVAVTGVAAFGAAVAGIGTASLKTAISFESAMAGVTKTTDGLTDSEGKLNEAGEELAQGFRDLAKEIPVPVEELLAIGELGGQLGVAKADLLDFTATIAAMGVSTNLSTDEAASGLARMANIMGTVKEEGSAAFSLLGSTIVDLGNNFATTESEVLNFGLRIAGAGEIAGLTEADVLAIGAAMSSVGVQAEAGGTAVQKVLISMNEAVAGSTTGFVDNTKAIEKQQQKLVGIQADMVRYEAKTGMTEQAMRKLHDEFIAGGGTMEEWGRKLGDTNRQHLWETIQNLDNTRGALEQLQTSQGKPIKVGNLQLFAKVSGRTAAQFKKDWEEDSGEVFKDFIEGLGDAGDDAIKILDELGLKDQRLVRSFLSLANAGELTEEAMQAATDAWAENTALAEEAEKRYATTESQMILLKNTIKDVGIGIGSALLPPFNELLGYFRDFINDHGPQLEALFARLGEWLKEKIPQAVNVLKTFWTTVLYPALTVVWKFIQEKVVPILYDLWEWLKAAIPRALAILSNFWTNVLVPALNAAWKFIQEKVVPILYDLWEWLKKAIPKALQAASRFWTKTLVPALKTAWKFIQEKVVPVLVTVWEWLKENIPKAIEAVSGFWTETLQPALEEVWGYIKENILPVFQTIWEWLQTNIPVAIQFLSDFWTNTLLPALSDVWEFIKTNIVPVFEDIVAWLGEKIPEVIDYIVEHWDSFKAALIAMGAVLIGAAVLGAILSIASAIAAIANPITLIIGAVGLLVYAWKEDWGGIRSALTKVWDEKLKPALEGLKKLLDEQIPQAIATLKGWWENTFKPALESAWTTADQLIQIIKILWDWLKNKIAEAFQSVKDWWDNTLKPALEDFWDFVENTLIPIIKVLWDWLKEQLTAAFETVKAFWEGTLKPALEEFWEFVKETLIPIISDLIDKVKETIEDALDKLKEAFDNVKEAMGLVWDYIKKNLLPKLQDLINYVKDTAQNAIDTFKSAITKVKTAFEKIAGAIKDALEWLKKLIDKIAGFIIPDWILRLLGIGGDDGTDSALARRLSGIAQSALLAAGAMSAFNGAVLAGSGLLGSGPLLVGGAGVGGGGTQITNNVTMPITAHIGGDMDMVVFERRVEMAVVKALRG